MLPVETCHPLVEAEYLVERSLFCCDCINYDEIDTDTPQFRVTDESDNEVLQCNPRNQHNAEAFRESRDAESASVIAQL